MSETLSMSGHFHYAAEPAPVDDAEWQKRSRRWGDYCAANGVNIFDQAAERRFWQAEFNREIDEIIKADAHA